MNPLAVYIAGLPVALIVISIWVAWANRVEIVAGTVEWEDSGIAPAFVFGLIFWPAAVVLGAGCLIVWVIIRGINRTLKRFAIWMIAVETRSERKQARKDLEAKAGEEIFVEVDRMLRESTQDEIASFMLQLKVKAA